MPQGQEKGRDGTNTLRPPSAFGVDVLHVGSQPQQPSLGAGDSPKAFQGDAEDPGSFRCHQPGTRTG